MIDTSELKLTRKNHENHKTIVNINGKKIGDGTFTIMAGPCAVDFNDDFNQTAIDIKNMGLTFLRGGAFKPRTSPYSFQGHKEEGLKLLREVADKYGLLVVTEVVDTRDVELVAKYSDILQIGTRNMQNFALLQEAGLSMKPVLLKRGFAATISEFLSSAEYVLSTGNKDLILCERGIRTFETTARNTLDINAIPILKELTHLPVIVDPSHASGIAKIVPSITKAILAVGADGAIIEAYSNPENALSDKDQTISTATLKALKEDLEKLSQVLEVSVQ